MLNRWVSLLALLLALLIAILSTAAVAAITELGALDTPGTANAVFVANDLACVADGAAGLRIIDVSDPAEPRQIGSFDTEGAANDVAVAGNYAFVAVIESGLKVIDLSDPSQPRLTAHVNPAHSLFYNLKLQGATLYVTDVVNGLRIYDVSDPAHPQQISLYDTPDFPYGLEVVDGVAYIADRQSGDSERSANNSPVHPTGEQYACVTGINIVY